jgi:general secretion pathway protein D
MNIKRILSVTLIFLLAAQGVVYGQNEMVADNLISLDFKGMDVVDVLKLLAQRGNINIAIGKNVRGKVTMFLKDVDVYDAFEIILASNDLAYERSGSVLTVMTDKDYERLYGQPFRDRRVMKTFGLQYVKAADVSKAVAQVKSKIGRVIVDEGANTIVVLDAPSVIEEAEAVINALDMPVETRVFALDYAKADEVKTKLEEKLTPNIGFVQVDERTNKVILTDLVSKMHEVESLISELDERTREVLIEAKILEVSLNDEFRWGVNWDKVFDTAKIISSVSGPLHIGVNFADAIAGDILPATDAGETVGGAIQLGDLTSNNSYESMIQVLDSMGKTEILSSPRIVVINNEEASILVGTNQPYATTGTTISDTVSQTTQQVTYVDLGVKLFVTPTINSNGYITMKIKPEVSSQTGAVAITSEEGTTTRTTEIPIISTSEAETTVMVRDGNTIVLAGLIEKRNEETTDKVPFFGDLPLIGRAFRRESKGSSNNPERKELVIFLTPHIISGDVESPEVDEYLTTPDIGKAEVRQLPKKKRVKTHFSWWGKDEETETIEDNGYSRTIPEAASRKTRLNMSRMSRKQYYNLVRSKVLKVVNTNYPRSGISGDVFIGFKLSSNGAIYGEPKLLAPADKTLKALAVKSVKAAAPFPRFPKSMPKRVEAFKIVITYK